MGRVLYRFARGRDDRRVVPDEETKSVSAETTFERDIADLPGLEAQLRVQCEDVARRMAAEGFLGRQVTLKLKTADFQILTRSRRLATPTRDVEAIWTTARALLEKEANGRAFRLIGAGCADLVDADAPEEPYLFSPELPVRRADDAAGEPVPPASPPRQDVDLFGRPLRRSGARRRQA
ncbi:DinB/UmuC family translesion DNA polymerase [Arenibaculum pallidiluteum]|uniref:DinB/UmuC family translesion DNA polymerase n=1 Tax=Arenibaculum pallidiluteum TaxID=2812559 RepID=UPI002E2C9FCD|nr:hypothetical protein [Arenibaculum pallidiluteum]